MKMPKQITRLAMQMPNQTTIYGDENALSNNQLAGNRKIDRSEGIATIKPEAES